VSLLKRRRKPLPLLEPPAWHERARAAAARHPGLTWGTLGALATFAAGVYPLWQAMDAHWQTSAEATRQYREIKRLLAWQAYALANQQVLVLRNRVNDCDAKRDATPLEYAACSDYRREYEDARKRSDEAYEAAVKASRD
jgi:hypothetical protein